MDLKSGYPFWAIKNGLMCTFLQLSSDIHRDVVVGGGITGALIADELGTSGFDVGVVEQRDPAHAGRFPDSRPAFGSIAGMLIRFYQRLPWKKLSGSLTPMIFRESLLLMATDFFLD